MPNVRVQMASRYRLSETVPVELPEEEPWLKLPEETIQAFEAFTIYRELGAERTYVRAETVYRERKNQKPPYKGQISSQFAIYVKRFQWKKRVELYDKWTSEQDLAVLREMRSKTLRKQAEETREVVDVMMHPIRGLKERIEQIVGGTRDDGLEDLSDAEYLQLGKAAAQAISQMHKNERDILGVDDAKEQIANEQLLIRAEAVRAAIQSPDTIAALEKFTLEVAVKAGELEAPQLKQVGLKPVEDEEQKSA